MNQPDLFQGFPTRDAALDAFEEHRGNWLGEARSVAYRICVEQGYATVDDVRRRCPPPKDVDPRIMGAIFNTSQFRTSTITNSDRAVCHKRPIRRFVLAAAA